MTNPIFTKSHICHLPCSKIIDFDIKFEDELIVDQFIKKYVVTVSEEQVGGLYLKMVKQYIIHKVQLLCKDTGLLEPLSQDITLIVKK
jgi:hypothetical protein